MTLIVKCDKCGREDDDHPKLKFMEGDDKDGDMFNICNDCVKHFIAKFSDELAEAFIEEEFYYDTATAEGVQKENLLTFFLKNYETTMLKWMKKRLK